MLSRHSSEKVGCDRGFTLIELLICAAIITMISAIVLVRFRTFDSTVILKSLAYEVASQIRETQSYSTSVVNTGEGASSATYRQSYGLSFDTTDPSTFTLFRNRNPLSTSRPRVDDTFYSTEIQTFSLGSKYKIADLCLYSNSTHDCQSAAGQPDRIDISFRRPEFESIFYAPGYTISELGDIYRADIKLQSTADPTTTWVIEIGLLGQVIVYKE